MAAVKDATYEYQAGAGTLNTRVARIRLKPGELSMAYGLDGRALGCSKKFPGMTQLANLAYDQVAWFKYISIQKGTSTDSYRGFLILRLDTATWKLTFYYYSTADTAYSSADMTCSGITLSATSIVDVDGNGKYAYVMIQGENPLVLYHSGSAFVEKTMGCGSGYLTPATPASSTASDGSGSLVAGAYRVGFRYYNSTRNILSGMYTTDVTVDDSDGDGDDKITVTRGTETPFTDGFDQVWMFRSLSADVAGTVYDAGILWRESITTLTSDTSPWAIVAGSLSDVALIAANEPYIVDLDLVGTPPQGGAIGWYDGVTFVAGDSQTGSAITELRFSPLADYRPEVFPANYVFKWSMEDGTVSRFCRAADFLYAWTPNTALRIAKLGTQMTITRTHAGRGLVARGAVSAVGRDMMAMTPTALMIVDGMEGTMNAVGAADGIVQTDWASTLSSVFVVSDFKMGATFVVNASTAVEEALVLWHVSGAVTQLDDCNFVWGTEGPTPSTGSERRAFFITKYGRILYPAAATATNSMLGIDSTTVTVNGTATGGSTTTLVDSAMAGWTTAILKSAKVYAWTGGTDTDPEVREVSSVSGTTITVSAVWTTAPASGTVYTISPVPLKLRFWPVPHVDPTMADFGRRGIDNVGVLAVEYTGDYDPDDNPAARWVVGAYRDAGSSIDDRISLDFTRDINDWENRFSALSVDGAIIEPYVEQIAADCNFQLLSVMVGGKMASNRLPGS